MKKDDLEDLFKKSFENYEAEVRPNVWKNIQVGLKWGSLALLFKTILSRIGVKTLIAVISSAAAIIGTITIMNWTNHKADRPSVSDKTGSPAAVTAPKSDTKEQLITSVPVENKIGKTAPINNNSVKAPASGQKEDIAKINTAASAKNDKKKIESVITEYSEEPVASISASPVGGTIPLIVNLVNSGTGKVNKWSYNDGKASVTTSNPVHVFENPGIYTVTLTSTDAAGKTATDSVKIEVKGNSSISSVPAQFSPNGDGVLDVFVFNCKNIEYLNAEIFDKKGTIVCKFNNISDKWDGKDLHGKKVKEGLYFYIAHAEGPDGKKYELKGSINLTR